MNMNTLANVHVWNVGALLRLYVGSRDASHFSKDFRVEQFEHA